MNRGFTSWKSDNGKVLFRSLTAALLAVPLSLVPAVVGAVETDRITVEDPATGLVKFKVTSDGNVTAASYLGDGAGLANVLHWKGPWNTVTAYAKDDCVLYGGSSWIALQPVTNIAPAANSEFWSVLASQGQTGLEGAQGPAGPPGPQGIPGTDGSPDTQAQILTQLATRADGTELTVQQGPNEAGTAVKLSVKNANGNTFVVNANGQVGIGTSTPSSKLQLNTIETAQDKQGATVYYQTAATGGYGNFGANFDVTAAPVTNSTAEVYALNGIARTAIGGAVNNKAIYGLKFTAQHRGTGTLTSAVGVNAYPYNGSTGTITNAYGLYTLPWMASGTISNWYGIFVDTKILGTGTVGNMYGVYVKEPAAKNYFAGNVGIGTTAPAQKLEVNGGVRINTASAQPTCDSAARGTFWFTNGGSGKDAVEVCAQDGTGTLAWRTLY